MQPRTAGSIHHARPFALHHGGMLPARRLVLLTLVFIFMQPAGRVPADVVEFLSGSKAEGKVVARDDKYISFERVIGKRTYSRRYPVERIRAVTIDGKREVLHEMPGGGGTSGAVRPGSTTPFAGSRPTPAEIEALVDRLGHTPPGWWSSVPLSYPKTLDLSWPQPPPKGWNNQRNVGQYVWDVINSNPGKWREGVRLMHHLLTVHKDNPTTRQRVMNELGRMYYALLQDYARAAFWWHHAGVGQSGRFPIAGVRLAECYWKLGSKEMAMDLLARLRPQFVMIKLWADMGETRRALQLADANTRGAYGDIACIYAGDACRVAGQYQQALQYYQTLLAMPRTGRGAQRIERNQNRARANIQAIRLFDTLDLRRVPDGTYRSSSLGYEAQVHVEVTVKGGRIESVKVTGHREKQFYSALADTSRKIVEKQGFDGIDATSGATITSEAIINAAAKALAEAMK